MLSSSSSNCPKCRGELRYYDKVRRMIRTKGGTKKYYEVERFRCIECNALHRALPNFIFPYKHYEADIINGVLNGLITSETLGFEDYPCETTMLRWTRK